MSRIHKSQNISYQSTNLKEWEVGIDHYNNSKTFSEYSNHTRKIPTKILMIITLRENVKYS